MKSGDADGGQTAGDYRVGGKAGDEAGLAGGGERGVADGEIELAGLGAIEAEADVEDFVGAEQVGVAERDLLVEDADGAVGLAVERDGDGGIVDAGLLAIADAQEG